jgi:Na+-transporting methylmalonyl-CoA/oxaloacetate decarboxylase gamma subunit
MSGICFNLLAAMTLQEKMIDAVTVTVVGMGIVIVALLVMGEIFKLLGRLLMPKEAPAEPVSSPSVPAPAPAGGIDPKLIVVLSAAAAAVVGKRVVVRRITFINHNTISGWSEAGRIGIQTSHNIRRN